MIDAASVFATMEKLCDQELNKARALAICDTVANEMSQQLKNESFCTEKSVIYACATVSLYRYFLTAGLSDENYESVKAGDVTVKRSASLVLEMAEKLRDEALSSASPYFTDMSFAFKVVKS